MSDPISSLDTARQYDSETIQMALAAVRDYGAAAYLERETGQTWRTDRAWREVNAALITAADRMRRADGKEVY